MMSQHSSVPLLTEPYRAMRLFLSFLILTSLANACIVEMWEYLPDGNTENKNCSGEPYHIEDWDSDGDCKWSTTGGAWSIKYHSDIGCGLSVFGDANCATSRVENRLQNDCLTPDFKMQAFVCLDD